MYIYVCLFGDWTVEKGTRIPVSAEDHMKEKDSPCLHVATVYFL